MNRRSLLVSVILLSGIALGCFGQTGPAALVSAAPNQLRTTSSDTSETIFPEGRSSKADQPKKKKQIKKKASKRTKVKKAGTTPAETSKQQKQLDRLIDDACEAYWKGKFSDALVLISRAEAIEQGNNDILILKEKINRATAVKRTLSERFTKNAQNSFEGGNLLHAFIEARMAVQLDKDNEDAPALLMDISETIETVSSGTDSERIKKKIKKGLKQVSEKKYERAIRTFRSLDSRLPQADSYVSVSYMHMADKRNRRRANEYYDRARALFIQRRYEETKEQLVLSLAIDDANLDALMLQEQLSMETMSD